MYANMFTGQVPYKSNVTYIEEMIPVTINLVAKRGCDFMLFNMVERLAKEGVLKVRDAFYISLSFYYFLLDC